MQNELKLPSHRLEQIREIDARFSAAPADGGQQWRDIGDLLDIVEFLQSALEQQVTARKRWCDVAAALALDIRPPAE